MKSALVRNRDVRCIILDFDGVILESASIKTEAFEEVFSRYPTVREAALAFHLSHKGISRCEKFRHLVHNLLGLSDSALVDALAEEFGRRVEERTLACPFVPGAIEFLERWHRRAPLYIASTAPPEELGRIVVRRGIGGYFQRILADTGPKAPLLAEILRQADLAPATAVFIGDSPSDHLAAVENGVSFIGLGDSPEFRRSGLPCFRDMFEVDAYLSGLVCP